MRPDAFLLVCGGFLVAWSPSSAAAEAVVAEIPELFKFDNFYEISLGISVVFLFLTLGWLAILRRKVREQAEQLREQFKRESALQKRYQELFEHANDVVLTLDRDGFIASLNKKGEEVFGCARERARTLKFSSFVNPSQISAFKVWVGNRESRSSESFEAVVTGADRGRSILELVGRPSTQEPEALEIIARDITPRRAAEEALRQSEERFSSAFRASPVAIAIAVLPEGRLLDVNQSFVNLFGYARNEAVGHTALDLSLWSSLEDKIHLDKALAESGSIGGVEVRFRVKSGELRTALVFMEQIVTGETSCLLWISHDMTDRLNLEAQVRHLLKMEAVGRLAAGVAHDFNNLLTVVQGNTDWVLKKYAREEDMITSLRRIIEATDRASNLTRQLLTFSRKENIALTLLDLNMAVTTATKMFKHLLRADIILKVHFAPNLRLVHADAPMLEQALMNLVVNARDAMAHGGELILTTRQATIDAAYVQTHPEAAAGEYVCLEVTDTGCGMDAATQARIFEPFFTTKAPGKGTGLGLATVYGIAKQHGGWIEVSSQINVGTTFKIFIPAETRDFPTPTLRRRVQDQKSILVLEDEPAVLELTSRFLADQGLRVLQATSGIEAMQVWSENPGDIQLLLTDVRIPLGMSGYDVAENLLALNPALKIIFVSGYPGENSSQEKALRRGSLFLSKPCAPEVLGAAVENALQSVN
jgi:two-component system cell cycle sensor histidine kinase/response regulator CckA